MRFKSFCLFFCMLLLVDCETGPENSASLVEPFSYAKLEKNIKDGKTKEALLYLEGYLNQKKAISDDEYYLYAMLLVASGEFGKAKVVLDKLALKTSHTENTLIGLAALEGSLGNRQRQIRFLQDAIQINPKSEQAYTAIGFCHYYENQPEKAKNAFGKALEINQQNAEAWFGLGVLAVGANKGLAETYFTKSLLIDPKNSLAWSERAKIRFSFGRFNESYQDFSRSIELEPEYCWSYIERSQIMLQNERFIGKALEDLDKAISLCDDNIYAYIYRSRVYLRQGKVEAAWNDYQTVKKIDPSFNKNKAEQGVLAYARKNWRLAGDLLLKGYEEERDPGLLLLSSLAYFNDGKDRLAKESIRARVKQIKEQKIFYGLANLFIGSGNESNIIYQIEKEPSIELKARYLFYVAAFFDAIKKNSAIATSYYYMVADLGVANPAVYFYEKALAQTQIPGE